MTITKNGKLYEVERTYPNFYLTKAPSGYRECFSKWEIDGVPNMYPRKGATLYYLDDKLCNINQLTKFYNLTRSQVVYRINNDKEMPDGRVVRRCVM